MNEFPARRICQRNRWPRAALRCSYSTGVDRVVCYTPAQSTGMGMAAADERRGPGRVAQLTRSLDNQRGALVTSVRRARSPFSLPLRITVDLALIFLGFGVAYLLRYELEIGGEVAPSDYRPFRAFLPVMFVLAAILMVTFAARGLYRLPRWTGLLDEALVITSSPSSASRP